MYIVMEQYAFLQSDVTQSNTEGGVERDNMWRSIRFLPCQGSIITKGTTFNLLCSLPPNAGRVKSWDLKKRAAARMNDSFT